jgi:hypothetical protein
MRHWLSGWLGQVSVCLHQIFFRDRLILSLNQLGLVGVVGL